VGPAEDRIELSLGKALRTFVLGQGLDTIIDMEVRRGLFYMTMIVANPFTLGFPVPPPAPRPAASPRCPDLEPCPFPGHHRHYVAGGR
jgi:hypothetical protein